MTRPPGRPARPAPRPVPVPGQPTASPLPTASRLTTALRLPAGLMLSAGLLVLGGCAGPAGEPDAAPSGTPSASAVPRGAELAAPSLGPAAQDWSTAGGGRLCPPATVTVGDAHALARALADARPGDSIRLSDGVYSGRFAATVPGAADRPVYLCGGPGAVLDGGGTGHGYALHLDGADHWRLTGFTVRNAQKGIMLDRTSHAVLTGLTVEHVGDEAIHLRAFSSDNVVQDSVVRDTGLRREKYGEGIYVGTAESNWCDVSGCEPDRSDRNTVRGNRIGATTAEPVDVKEGTTGGLLTGNTFDGAAMTGSYADSWVDVKGNGWTIRANTGRHSRGDGFQTHSVADGWGVGNVFTGNTAHVDGPGWGFHVSKGNTVACDNTVTGAARGTANVTCRGTW